MQTLTHQAEGTLKIKKSTFIARIYPTKTEEEAQNWIKGEKKTFYDARHHCYAYLIGEQQNTQKSNDDGEPAGTAGKPILETLEKHDLTNVTAIVTRYFGGTLLGTGGLIRAYTHAVLAALQAAFQASHMVELVHLTELKVSVSYAFWEKLKHLVEQKQYMYEAPLFAADVTVQVALPAEETASFRDLLMALTGGEAKIRAGAQNKVVHRPVNQPFNIN